MSRAETDLQSQVLDLAYQMGYAVVRVGQSSRASRPVVRWRDVDGKWRGSGFSDLMVISPGGRVVFIELKTQDKHSGNPRTTEAQMGFGNWSCNYKIPHYTCRSFEDAETVLHQYRGDAT